MIWDYNKNSKIEDTLGLARIEDTLRLAHPLLTPRTTECLGSHAHIPVVDSQCTWMRRELHDAEHGEPRYMPFSEIYKTKNFSWQFWNINRMLELQFIWCESCEAKVTCQWDSTKSGSFVRNLLTLKFHSIAHHSNASWLSIVPNISIKRWERHYRYWRRAKKLPFKRRDVKLHILFIGHAALISVFLVLPIRAYNML